MGDNFDAAKENAKKFCAETGAYFVEDGRDIAISEGAGSIAVELMQQRTFDAVLVPLGNGALIGGVSRYIKHVAPDIQIIGVSSATADAMEASWRYGKIEVRAKLPQGQGTWPAIWMLPEKNGYGPWAASGEIDILEAVNLGVRWAVSPRLFFLGVAGVAWPGGARIALWVVRRLAQRERPAAEWPVAIQAPTDTAEGEVAHV